MAQKIPRDEGSPLGDNSETQVAQKWKQSWSALIQQGKMKRSCYLQSHKTRKNRSHLPYKHGVATLVCAYCYYLTKFPAVVSCLT